MKPCLTFFADELVVFLQVFELSCHLSRLQKWYKKRELVNWFSRFNGPHVIFLD